MAAGCKPGGPLRMLGRRHGRHADRCQRRLRP